MDETVRPNGFNVVICRRSEFRLSDSDCAAYELAALADEVLYTVGHETDVEGARRVAATLERPSERTHRLSFVHGTRTARLTPELYRLTGRASMSTSFLRVWWAPPGSEFQVGAEYDRPLDARHPRWVTEADLHADGERRSAVYPFWQHRVVDAEALYRETAKHGVHAECGRPSTLRM